MWSIPSLPWIQGPFWFGLLPHIRVPSTELFNNLLYLKPFNCVHTINCNAWNHLTVCKLMSSETFKNNVTNKLPNHIYVIYMYKKALALNNPRAFICRKTQPNQIITWNHLTVCKQTFKNVTYTLYADKSYLSIYLSIYLLTVFGLNNLRGLIWY